MSITKTQLTMRRNRALFYVVPFVLAAVVVLLWPTGISRASVVHHIDLDSSQFAFEPGRINVQTGDEVVLNLTASDVVHGFYLDGYGLETRVEPGISQEIVFVADQPGKFRFRCSVSCGPLHPFMIGELVVTPNAPFWKAALVMLLLLGGMLVYLWQANSEREVGNASKI